MFSFTRRKRQIEVQQQIRRIIDRLDILTSLPLKESRAESRSNKMIPVLLCPLEGGEPQRDRSALGLSRDFSGNGLCVVLQTASFPNAVAAMFYSEGRLQFMSGEIRNKRSLGSTYWLYGLELTDLLIAEEHSAFQDKHNLVALLDYTTSPAVRE